MLRPTYSKVTRSMLNWLAIETEKAQGRGGIDKKFYKVSKPRNGEEYHVTFYGYSAYIALRDFERRLRVAGVEFTPVRTDEDRVATIAIRHVQGGRLRNVGP